MARSGRRSLSSLRSSKIQFQQKTAHHRLCMSRYHRTNPLADTHTYHLDSSRASTSCWLGELATPNWREFWTFLATTEKTSTYALENISQKLRNQQQFQATQNQVCTQKRHKFKLKSGTWSNNDESLRSPTQLNKNKTVTFKDQRLIQVNSDCQLSHGEKTNTYWTDFSFELFLFWTYRSQPLL